MPAVQQMLAFLYHIERKATTTRSRIYENFFKAPFVRQYCDREGIPEPTLEASRRRCPFLLNILDACGIIDAGHTDVTIRSLVLSPYIVQSHVTENAKMAIKRLDELQAAWPDKAEALEPAELSILRELFGPSFLTRDYHLTTLQVVGR